MKVRRLSTFSISAANLLHRRYRTLCLVILVAWITLIMAIGSVLGTGLLNGVHTTQERLGADAIVVPRNASRDLEGALLTGVPSTFYIDGNYTADLQLIDGVEKLSPQIYVSTFKSEHCAAQVQVIGYEPKTDFVITPWLSDRTTKSPEYGEVVVGNSVYRNSGDEMLIFGRNYKVIARLDKTGMGFDQCVFANMETTRTMIADYEELPGSILMPEGENLVSAIMVDLRDDYEPKDFAILLLNDLKKMKIVAVLPQAMIDSISKNLDLTITILIFLVGALWILSLIVLAIVITVTLNERKREFGVFRALGATRRKLLGIFFTESSLIGIVGAGIGIGLASLVIFPFNLLIEEALDTTYLLPDVSDSLFILLGVFVISAAMGPLASIYSARKMGREETFFIIRDGE
ncbi:MAG: ABC transporter permease [Clostridiales Family XIII bacterium]|jgi:putative ABC transport system permease protein|nr:ABC transporter permease [Clostridiales Family XIII bacterium]